MGAQNFWHVAEGLNIREVYEKLRDDAISEYGHDPYNGTISTCNLSGRPMKVFGEYKKSNETAMMKWIAEDEDYGVKGTARYIDLGIIGYKVRELKKINHAPTAEFKMRFCVVEIDYSRGNKVLKYYENKKEADTMAMIGVMSGRNLQVEKRHVNVKPTASSVTTTFSVTEKMYKTKPKLQDNSGRIVVPIHRYLLYGWASS